MYNLFRSSSTIKKPSRISAALVGLTSLFGSYFISPTELHAEPAQTKLSAKLTVPKPKKQQLGRSCTYHSSSSGNTYSVSFSTDDISFILSDLEKIDKPVLSDVTLFGILVYDPSKYNESFKFQFSKVSINSGKVIPALEQNACPNPIYPPPPRTKAEIAADDKRADAKTRAENSAMAKFLTKYPSKSYPIPDRADELADALEEVIPHAITMLVNLNNGKYLGTVKVEDMEVVSRDNDFFYIQVKGTDQLFTLSRKLDWSSVQNPEYVIRDYTYRISELFINKGVVEVDVDFDCATKGRVTYGPSPPNYDKEMPLQKCIDE